MIGHTYATTSPRPSRSGSTAARHPAATRVLPSLRRRRSPSMSRSSAAASPARRVAWRFAEAGFRVALVEATRVGRGSTAASTALLMQEPDDDFASWRGATASRARGASGSSAGGDARLHSTPSTADIACDLRPARLGVLHADTRATRRRLRARAPTTRQTAGLRRTLARRPRPAAPDRASTGTGAIRTHGNGQADPYRACLGSSRAARARGARLFERSPVQRDRAVAATVSPSSRARGRHHARPRRHRHRLCDAVLQAARRALPPAAHLRRRDAPADRGARAPSARPWRRHAVGHRTALPLRALDRGSSPAARRRRSTASSRAGAAARALREGVARVRDHFERLLSRARDDRRSNSPGKGCSRRRRTGSPTSARTGTTRGICSRSATAATA